MKRALTLATVALFGLAAAIALTLVFSASGPSPGSPSGSPDGASLAGSADDTTDVRPTDEYPSRLLASESVEIPQQLPDSLSGTSVPRGWDQTDVNGELVPTPQLRQLFEHYLAALGEETLEQLIARIERALSILHEPARSQAINILGSYLDYKLELGELESAAGEVASMSPDAMASQLARIRALRRQWMDTETTQAFFALEEAVDQYQLARLRIRADESLSAKAREQQLREAEQALPAPVREARQRTRKFSEYEQVQQALADDPQALQAWRVDAFGMEAAERLAQVEADQQAWGQRWQAYRQAKAELEKLGLAGPEREAAINRLRQQHFTGAEIYRAEALDSIQ
ncbi:lipase secretion chaperone [Marinobacter halotolerans]|uniref:lipase secretion chaperone n=1 Tax=Marinobacter halotolerans TaxID=1569211 RepID=UPI0012470446|nr:lipase secretion chaperone [Marinobacter halotolerans]